MKISSLFVTLITPLAWGDEAKHAGLRGGGTGKTPDPEEESSIGSSNVTDRVLTLTTCQDFPSNWYDADGSLYDCNWYAQGTNCRDYGSGSPNMGFTANKACCACGGGLSYASVMAAVQRKGYVFFTGKYNLNLVGIRGLNLQAGQWDDTFCVLYQDEYGQNRFDVFSRFTTNPGIYYLQHPLQKRGCAIVAPGQYRGIWKNGRHKNLYPALVQAQPISVYRDNTTDDKLDFVNQETRTDAWPGINLHHGKNSAVVGKYSAGCQVFKSPSDLTKVLGLTAKQRASGYGSTYTYTLLEAWNL